MESHNSAPTALLSRPRPSLAATATVLALLLCGSSGVLGAAPPPPCFQQASSLSLLLSSIVVCWNDFTDEFEIYFTPKTGTVAGGACGNGGVVPTSIAGGLAYNPPNLLWEIHIVPDELEPEPEDSISLGFRVRGYKKPLPLTPLEYSETRTFYPLTLMESSSPCLQIFP